ncbi:9196_t:CDS:2 [Ambispora leptoticha]|uniref:9196_t:CDS:1 n=1 Tax=Ambispora leptoticha TaxID=144679 RepID=A0A9N8YYQ1_9GLOM|nr:9196_t:CDS:2 [Ambispora leptoticha]
MSFSSSPSKKSNHEERTASILRRPEKVSVVIRKITQETPTVKSFVLEPKVTTPKIDFLPGQWLDVFIPNVSTVGGFSITSTPRHFHLTNTLDLAIKYSTHPPAKWFHEEATLGNVVDIRVGGEFYYDDQEERENGTQSIDNISLQKEPGKAANNNIEKIQLLYSAKTLDELLFFERIERLKKNNSGLFDCFYFLTREDSPTSSTTFTATTKSIENISTFICRQRINEKFLIDLLTDDNDLKHLKSFLCGPTQMQDDVAGWLVKGVGLSENQIVLEKWE